MKRAMPLFFIAFLFFTCDKKNENPAIDLSQTITTSIQGNIVDISNQPLSGVKIQIGNAVATTDSKGYFKLVNITLNIKATVVHIQKAGYFESVKTWNATRGNNYIRIKMLPRNIIGTFNAASGGQIVLSNNSSISIPANSVVNKLTGNVYNGDINVFAFYIDPSLPGFEEQIPGSLMAKNSADAIVALNSFAMLAVELESPSGDNLQLASDKTAGLAFAIPAALVNNAPAHIPLWYLNEGTGFWEQQGTASKTGGRYVGTVTHFSFWNCDIAFPSTFISMKLVDVDFNPLPYTKIKIRRNSSITQSASYGYTDSLGFVSGLVPTNENLVMEVMNHCDEILFTKNIGPFTNETDMGNIIIQNAVPGRVVKVSGKVISCSNNIVRNGYVHLQYGNNEYTALIDTSGNFSLNIIKCDMPNIAFLSVTDVFQSQQSLSTQITLLSPVTNVGVIQACGTSTTQFFNYYIDTTYYTISSTNPTHTFTGLRTTSGTPMEAHSVAGRKQQAPNDIIIQFKDNYQNVGPGQYVFINLMNYRYLVIAPPSQITITNLPPVGGFYEGSFNTNFKDSINVIHNLHGTFRVKREL